MKIEHLKPRLRDLPLNESMDIINRVRESRFKPKSRPKHIRKKIEKKRTLLDALSSMSREELLKLKEALEK